MSALTVTRRRERHPGRPARAATVSKPRSRVRRWNTLLRAADALRGHHAHRTSQRLRAGEACCDSGLVFCSATGRPLDAANGRRVFRLVTRKAGIGESWSPRELRHSFVSIMSDGGVPIEAIADLCGHSSPAVSGQVYRHQLRRVISRGARVADSVFGTGESA